MENKFDRLAQIIANFTKIYAHFAQNNGLSYNELHFLYYLAQNKQATPSAISQRWSIPKQTINSICHKFSKKELIAIEADDHDKRKKIIRLTNNGQKYIKPLIKQISQAELQIQQQFSASDFDQFLDLFDQLTQAFATSLK